MSATAVEVCEHYWCWASPAGARGSARICMLCHQPNADWLNEIDNERDRLRGICAHLEAEVAWLRETYDITAEMPERVAVADGEVPC